MNKDYKLIIFDLDGTLAQFKTGEILDGVKGYFEYWLSLPEDDRPHLALATNQGGVGLRYWMESDDFGNPANYPTQEDTEKHIDKVLDELGLNRNLISVFVSYRYISQKGNDSPVPDYGYADDNKVKPEWSTYYRKPNAGMLADAMAMHFVKPEDTLVVGDRDEDRQAAENAGCDFMDANEFFNRNQENDDIPF